MAHCAETWEAKHPSKEKLAAAQTTMERNMLDITYKRLGKRKDKDPRRD